jgi:hypothetical protein
VLIMARNRGATDIDQMSVAWSRGRVLLVFGTSGLFLLGLLAGLVMWLGSLIWPGDDDQSLTAATAETSTTASPHSGGVATGPTTAAAPGQAVRDELASRPMPTTTEDLFTPSALSSRELADPITLPRGKSADDLGVVTGFTRTPEGAMAQLAAIDQAAIATGSLPGARKIIDTWAEPGGPTGSTWLFGLGMKELFDSAELPPNGSSSLLMDLTPSMGQIKGSVGRDYAVVCVDYVLEVALQKSTMVAVADCQRMVWSGDRWRIGDGAQPFQASPVWPGTDAAIDLGWKEIADA